MLAETIGTERMVAAGTVGHNDFLARERYLFFFVGLEMHFIVAEDTNHFYKKIKYKKEKGKKGKKRKKGKKK